MNGYVPAYLATGLHLDQLLVGVIFTVVLAGSVVGPVASGIVADRVGRWVVVVITYIFGGAALAAFGMTGPNVILLLLFGLLVGVFAYAESPLLQALWADATRGAPQQAYRNWAVAGAAPDGLVTVNVAPAVMRPRPLMVHSRLTGYLVWFAVAWSCCAGLGCPSLRVH